MVFCRKETKDYGLKRPVEGKYESGQKCLVVEDVFVSGQSTMETAEVGLTWVQQAFPFEK